MESDRGLNLANKIFDNYELDEQQVFLSENPPKEGEMGELYTLVMDVIGILVGPENVQNFLDSKRNPQ